MTAAGHGPDVLADPDLPLLRFTRDFAFPPAAVFRAHADPDLVTRWLGPRGSETHIDHYTCRTGGSCRYVQRCGAEESVVLGCFHEVRSAASIVETFASDAVPDVVALVRRRFEPIDDEGTRLSVTWAFEGFEARDAFLSAGIAVGVRESYERLDELLAR